jgi:hypothetical protein
MRRRRQQQLGSSRGEEESSDTHNVRTGRVVCDVISARQSRTCAAARPRIGAGPVLPLGLMPKPRRITFALEPRRPAPKLPTLRPREKTG